MRRNPPALIVALLVGAFTATAAAAPSPAVAPGWPRNAAAGAVLPGPDGGVVVVSTGHRTSAFRRDGRRLWTYFREAGCGNCYEGLQPEALQPDGTYGPVGPEGSDFWAVDRTGREVRGCAGVVTPDGACFFATSVPFPPPGDVPMLIARSPDGSVAWRAEDPGYRWVSDAPPVVVRDATGLIYSAFGYVADATSGAVLSGRLIAADPSARTILWARNGPTGVLTALGSGMLANRPDGIVAFAPDGSERWSRPGAFGSTATTYDAPRDRVYLDRTSGVTALVASTGAQVWRTRPRDRARLLSVGPGGRVYLAIGAPGRRAVRAVRIADGRTVWERRTRLPVLGARELADGMVAVSAGNRYAPTAADRLTLLRPGG